MDGKNAETTKRSHAYKGSASSFNVDILNSFNPELRLKDTKSAIRNKLIGLLSELRGFKFATTLVIGFKKIESDDATKYNTFYFNSNINESVYNTITSNIKKYIGNGLDRIIDSVVSLTINILTYNPLAGSSYIKLLKQLVHPRKGLIYIQIINDNKCFKWLVRYLHLMDHNPRRI